MKTKSHFRKFSKGFTLIELLIVIAVLGVLAAGVLVAIDPFEQLARGRDTGRKSSVTQLGRALQSYFTTNTTYPATASWNTDLLGSGDIKVFPSNPAGGTTPSCTGGTPASRFCYKSRPTPADIVVYTGMESKSEANKCAGVVTWYVYSSAEGKAGLVCGGEPAAGATGLL